MGNNEPAVDQSDFRIRDSYGLNATILVEYTPDNSHGCSGLDAPIEGRELTCTNLCNVYTYLVGRRDKALALACTRTQPLSCLQTSSLCRKASIRISATQVPIPV